MWLVSAGPSSHTPSPPSSQMVAVTSGELADPAGHGQEAEHQERQRVGDQVRPAAVQQRGEQHAVQPVELARLDAALGVQRAAR